MDASLAEGQPSSDVAAIIARQQAEIESLKRRIADDRFGQDLRDALTTASATATIAPLVNHAGLLKMIVATAADIVDARAAWLFLIDAEQESLLFGAAWGGEVADAAGIRIPLGHGLAGLVAQTAEPIAMSDTPEDDLDEADLGHAVGFNPTTVLCVPLSFQDRVIGVLEFLDREEDSNFGVDQEEASNFGAGAMEAMGLFADVAAVAIEQSRTQTRLDALLAGLVENVDGLPDFDRHGLTERARTFTAELGQQTGYLDALELARLVQEIAQQGDSATEACKGILNSFVEFLRSRRMAIAEGGLI
jgi:GAF domain-containing protein